MQALAMLMAEAERTPPEKMPPRASRWLRFMRWIGLAAPQGACVWCPTCGNELVSCPDSPANDLIVGVAYVCAVCDTGSLWDFDSPVPFLSEYTTPGHGPEWMRRANERASEE